MFLLRLLSLPAARTAAGMRRRNALGFRLGIGLCLLLCLPACRRPQSRGDDADATGAAPAPAIGSVGPASAIADAATQQFLVDVYGPSASLQRTWVDDRGGAARICADAHAVVDGRALRLLAVCTTAKRSISGDDSRVDMYMLAAKDGKLATVAESRGQTFWFNGAPPQVKTVRIGRDRYAFEILARVLDDYGTVQQRTWYAAHGAAFAKVLSLPAHYAADGTAWCRYAETTTCNGSATDIAYDLCIDDHDAGADAYPLRVDLHGIRCDRPIAASTTSLAFDAAASAYRVPTSLHVPTTDCAPGERSQPPHQD